MEKKELSIEERAQIGRIAKSLGQKSRFNLFKILLENKSRAIPLQELSKMIGSSYRNVQVHIQTLADAGLVEIIPKSDPILVHVLKSVHFFERKVTFVEERETAPEKPKELAEREVSHMYIPHISDYTEITDEETIVKIAKGLGHPTRIYIMELLLHSPFSHLYSLPLIEKLLRGKPYECSYYNIKQHIDKMKDAGIVSAEKDFLFAKKYAVLAKFIKIETQDIKS